MLAGWRDYVGSWFGYVSTVRDPKMKSVNNPVFIPLILVKCQHILTRKQFHNLITQWDKANERE